MKGGAAAPGVFSGATLTFIASLMRFPARIDYAMGVDLSKSRIPQWFRRERGTPMADLITADYLEIDPAKAERRQVYRMLVGSVVPRPIGWASTVDLGGHTNLAPFSFFTVVCVVPPMISLTIARNPDGSEKHTLKNVRDTGEFCFNIVTEPVWKEMVDSANGFPEGDSEFDKTGLTPDVPATLASAQDMFDVVQPARGHANDTQLNRALELLGSQ